MSTSKTPAEIAEEMRRAAQKIGTSTSKIGENMLSRRHEKSYI